MEELKNNHRYLIIISGLLLVVVILFVIALSGGKISKLNESFNRQETNLEIEEIDIYSEDDIKLQDTIIDYINSGVSGLYTIGDRHFIILTSGNTNYSDIEYKLDTDSNGGYILNWWFSDISDNSKEKISYKVLEVNNTDIRIIKGNQIFNELDLSGFCEAIVFKYNNKSIIYSTNHGKTLNIETMSTPGTYMIEFKDGKIEKMTKIDTVILKDCIISGKDGQSDRLYKVKLADGTDIEIFMDKLNIDMGTVCNISVNYDSVLGIFKGSMIGGIV